MPEYTKKIEFEDIKKTTLKKIFVPANINIIFDNDINKETFINNDKIIIDNLEIIKYNNFQYLISEFNYLSNQEKTKLTFNHPVKEFTWRI